MESLKISTGAVKLQIVDDDGEVRGIFKFRPDDVHSAQAMLELQKELDIKQAEFDKRAETCETQEEQIALLNEIVDYFEDAIDKCFGEGSSKILFGEAKTLTMFEDFFNGIIPYYQKASNKRVAKYKKKSGK